MKKRLLTLAFPLKQYKRNIDTDDYANTYPKGINLIGYARAEMGIGESCRLAARSISAVNHPFGILNFKGTNIARMEDITWAYKEVNNPIYNVNIFHINAEQMMEIYAYYGNKIFENRYNIGYWHWELPEFPDEWLAGFNFVNEIWVPSNFVANALALKSPVPVIRIPHGIEVNITTKRTRTYFQLPKHSFLFLTMYDVKSNQTRKNPKASINAFKLAFDPNDLNVGLVIKINNAISNMQELQSVYDLVGDFKNIFILKETLSRGDTNSLIDVTDSYISLHRSEGFGLGLAEAMYLGKPAIGTNWSSNTDFMSNTNSCLVNYDLVKVGTDQGPYKAYQYWANPDIEHASYYMKLLVSDSEYYKKTSLNGEQSIKQNFSPKVIGETITKRLKYLNLL